MADKWTKKADMPTARTDLYLSVVNGKIYAIGGLNGSFLSIVEEYAPATDTWTKKADMPTARVTHTAVVNGKIYAIGGAGGQLNPLKLFSTVEIYHPETDTWTKGTDLPTARCCFSSNTVKGVIYVIGGSDLWPNGNAEPLSYLATVEAYDTGFAVDAKGKFPTLWGLLKLWERFTTRR